MEKRNLKEIAGDFDIRLLDKVNFGKKGYFSFLEGGLIAEEMKEYSYTQQDFSIKKENFAKEYADPYIKDFKKIDRNQDFLKHYIEKELKGLSMTEDFNKVKETLKIELSEKEKEIFAIMYIDKKNKIIKKENLFEGTIDRSMVYMRELSKKIINEKSNYDGIVVVHNHPGGSLDTSSADIHLTKKLKEIFTFLDTKLKDHLIVSKTGVSSFCELGILEKSYNTPKKARNIKNKELER